MQENGNKTIMCSVFFLDIVGYSKKSVTGQISLKERFNRYLSTAIRDVPVTDRIILDTGDGAAINFLGDIEDALKAALSLRENLLGEDPNIEHPLRVRMGINLGPVRLVRDINGQPNIVGDGINVAQRVMGFADVSQILVSRSYYDAVSRVSPQYAGMFHFQGSRTDKHVREHEVYAIGYRGDRTTIGRVARLYFEHSEGPMGKAYANATKTWRSAIARLDGLKGKLETNFRQAEPGQRAIYVGVGSIPLLMFIVLLIYMVGHNEIPAKPAGMDQQAENSIKYELAPVPVSSVSAVPAGKTGVAQSNVPSKMETPQIAESKRRKVESRHKPKVTRPKVQDKTITHDAAANSSDVAVPTSGSGAYLSVRCIEGTEVFLDGSRKGRISGSALTINAPPGPHTVIVSHPRGVDSRNVVLEAGKTVRINPDFCN
ncbi:MAG: adenylate/guanylate cyclase domain-containing protein [Gallionella sp.]